MIALLLLLGCPKATPPAVFPDAFPQVTNLEAPEFLDGDDACPRAVPYLPGRPAPYVLDGAVSCRGTVVRESYVLGCKQAKDERSTWLDAASTCYAGRAIDRAHAQHVVNRMHAYETDIERDNRALRYAGPVLFVSGVIVGAAVGVAASQVDQAILP